MEELNDGGRNDGESTPAWSDFGQPENDGSDQTTLTFGAIFSNWAASLSRRMTEVMRRLGVSVKSVDRRYPQPPNLLVECGDCGLQEAFEYRCPKCGGVGRLRFPKP